jgi:tetratricopeptide (TPR) repeat protein
LAETAVAAAAPRGARFHAAAGLIVIFSFALFAASWRLWRAERDVIFAENALARGDAGTAQRALDAVGKNDPANPLLYSLRARMLALSGQYDGALAAAETASRLSPHTARFHEEAAAIAAAHGKGERASVEYFQAAGFLPLKHRIWMDWVDAEIKAGPVILPRKGGGVSWRG